MANKVAITKAKKGDTVMLCMFTGMRVGPKEVIACDKDTVTISRNNGLGDVTFDRKTGKQLNPMPKNARYASFITEDDGTYVHPVRDSKKKSKNTKTKVKPPKAKPIKAAEDDEPEEETPAPKKKATKKKAAAPKKKPEPQPEPEEDEDEEWDDDDFEEVE